MDDKLKTAFFELQAATEAYDEAHEAYRAASHHETDARNRLNNAQKKFDAVIADMKKSAPRDSDWNRSKGIQHEQ